MILTIPFSIAVQRISPIQRPRRDLVMDWGDNVRLAVTLYTSETNSTPMELDGYSLFLRVFPSDGHWHDDYGWPLETTHSLLTLEADIEDDIANFDFVSGIGSNLSTGRYGFKIFLTDEGQSPEESAVICGGIINAAGGRYTDSDDALLIENGEALLLEDP